MFSVKLFHAAQQKFTGSEFVNKSKLKTKVPHQFNFTTDTLNTISGYFCTSCEAG